MSDSWHYVSEGRTFGPVTRAQLLRALRDEGYWRLVPVWKPGFRVWAEAGSIRELSVELAELDEQSGPPLNTIRNDYSGLLFYAAMAVVGVAAAVVFYLVIVR